MPSCGLSRRHSQCERASAADDAVAGHDDAEGVAADRAAHCAHGAGPPDAAAQSAIAGGAAALNSQQRLPDGLLKGAASAQVKRQVKTTCLPGKVGRQLRAGGLQNGVGGLLRPKGCVAGELRGQGRWQMPLLIKPSTSQTVGAGHQGQVTQRGWAAGLNH